MARRGYLDEAPARGSGERRRWAAAAMHKGGGVGEGRGVGRGLGRRGVVWGLGFDLMFWRGVWGY